MGIDNNQNAKSKIGSPWSSFGGGTPQANSGLPNSGQGNMPSSGGMPASVGNFGGNQWLQTLIQKLQQGGGMN